MKFTNLQYGDESTLQQNVEEIIKFNDKNMYNQYSKFLEETPIFAKAWYKQSKKLTTTDTGFGNNDLNLGKTSPIRFNKINNVPIYGITDSQIDVDDGEIYGIEASYHNECVIPPGIFEPIPNDYLVINMMGKDLLFKVTNVSYDTIKSNQFYKVDFKFDKYYDDTVEEQVVDEYDCIFSNIGTEDNALIKRTDCNVLSKLKSTYRYLYNKYIKYFYDYCADCLLFKKKYYDPYLTRFIIDNDVFKQSGFDYIILFNKILELDNFDILYSNTIYDIIENKTKTKFKKKCRDACITLYDDVSYLSISRYNYKFFDFNKSVDDNFMYYIKYIDNDLEYGILNNNIFEVLDNSIDIFKNIIIMYMNDNDDIYDMISKINNIKFFDIDNICYFNLVPIVLYIIKILMGNIILKYNIKEEI